jgi:hypothetical protein
MTTNKQQTKMNKEFIPYELALEIKQLGFTEPCLASYYHAGRRLDICEYINHGEYTVLAPTYSQAFRWFREKHNLKSWIQEHTSDTFIYEIRPHVLSDYKQGETYVYTNYEKVELACLKKLIEIVKITNNKTNKLKNLIQVYTNTENMTNNKLNLSNLYYHLGNRATGKTTLLQTGIKNYDKPFLFVCTSTRRGEFETDKNPNAIYITEETQDKLFGVDYPIILNHDVISWIIDRVFDLESENQLLKNKLEEHINDKQ